MNEAPDVYQTPLAERYATREMLENFSPRERYRTWRRLWIALAEAEAETLAFVAQHVDSGVSPMCGNSIGQDRRFLARYMPSFEAFFHYRNLDVSSVKELARRWRPDVLDGVQKSGAHLALDDIRESIAELQHYRETFFKMEA